MTNKTGKSTKKADDNANIERMYGILFMIIRKTTDSKLLNEYEGLIKLFEKAEALQGFEVKRIEKSIITKLGEIRDMEPIDANKAKIIEATAEIGILMLEREQKSLKYNKNAD